MAERYINPHTDFGFKRLFGTEFNKELLISFLNALFAGKETVVDLTYLSPEHLGDRRESRRAIFDVYCQNEKGERFIVEMQNVFQEFFKDRTVYYSTFPIREQALRSQEWDFRLNSVYTIGLLNFIFHDEETGPSSAAHSVPEDGIDVVPSEEPVDVTCPWHHVVKLMDVDRKTVFYDKLTYIYEEIPKFNKTESELTTMFDKWMYVLRNLSRLLERPATLQERVFKRLFDQAEIARFNKEEMALYEDSVKSYRDILNAIKTAEKIKYTEGREEGRAEGREEGRAEGRKEGRAEGREERNVEIARKMLTKGMSIKDISDFTDLSQEEIKRLSNR